MRIAATGSMMSFVRWVILVLVGAVAIGWLVCGKSICARRQAGAQQLIDHLGQAADLYFNDHGAYPPGDGAGTASLARALQTLDRKNRPYMEFRSGDLDASGNIRSPLEDGAILYYRNNRVNFPANQNDSTARNKQRFDLWCADCAKNPQGINNWGGD